MTEVKPSRRIVAPPDAAAVVFVRPSKLAFAISANIIDENGRFVGDIPAKGHFAAILPPGHHTLVVWAENTDALSADLAPGRIYFVEVYATPGAFSAQMHLKAIKPTLPNWGHKDEWMQDTTQFAVDQQGGQENLYRKGEDKVRERVRRGLEHMSKYDGERLDSRTLRPEDGI
jgi:hypothetical protein